MSNQDPNKSSGKEKLTDDMLKSIIPTVVPLIVKHLLEFIPADSKLDDTLRSLKNYAEKFAPLLTSLILHFTNMPDKYDDILAEVNAELGRAIKEKYSSKKAETSGFVEHSENEEKKTLEKKEKIIILASSLETTQLQDFLKLVNAITDEEQKIKFLNYLLPLDSGKSTVESWAKLDIDSFKVIVQVLTPKTVEKKENWLEEEIKTTVSSIKMRLKEKEKSYQEDLAEPTILERIGKKVDFLGIMK